MAYQGNFALGDTVDFKFNTIAPSTGAPTTLAGTPTLACYVGNSTTEITAGITLTVDFDSRTGTHHVRVVISAANGYASMSSIDVVVTAGTVGGQSIVGYVVGSFSIDARSLAGGMPAGAIASLGIVDNGIAQAAASTTFTLRSAASFSDAELQGATVVISSGTTGAGERRIITGYVNSTKVATVDPAWTTTPTGTILYVIFGTAPGSSVSAVPVNVVQWNGSAIATPATSGIPEVNVAKINNVATTSVTAINANQGTTQPLNFTGTSSSALVKTDVVDFGGTAGSFTSGKPDVQGVAGSVAGSVASVTGAVGSVTGAVGSVTGNVGGNVVGSVASVTGNVGGNVTGTVTTVTGNVNGNVNGSVASLGAVGANAITRASFAADTGMQSSRSSTAQAGSANTITLDASASATDNYYTNSLIYLTGGTGAGEARFITGYVGSTKVATVDSNWVTNPSSATTFAIMPFSLLPGATAPTASTVAAAVWNYLTSAFATTGSVGLLVGTNLDAQVSKTLQPIVPGNKAAVNASGQIGVDWSNVGGQTTSVNLAGTIIAQSAAAPTTGSLTAQQKVDVTNAVWEVAAAAHDNTATMGEKMNDAGSSADPLTNPVGTYGSGTVGEKIQNSSQTTTMMQADVRKINGITTIGAGVPSNPYKPA